MGFFKHNDNKDINDILAQFTYEAATTYGNMDYWNKRVQFTEDGNDAVSSEAGFVMVCPPRYVMTKNVSDFLDKCIPLGGLQQYNPSESKAQMPVGEIGSKIKRVVPGRTQYGLSLSRLFTRHSNIKSALYEWLFKYDKAKAIKMGIAPGPNGLTYWSGLESEIYGVPFGIIGVSCAVDGGFVGADMHEMCYLLQAGTPKQAGQDIMIDGAAIYVTRTIPLVDSSNKIVKDFHSVNSSLKDYTAPVFGG